MAIIERILKDITRTHYQLLTSTPINNKQRLSGGMIAFKI